jgi:serine/threonine protein kinase/Tfp pilus assembly protein PilF
MSEERDRAPLPTGVSAPETLRRPPPSGDRSSDSTDESPSLNAELPAGHRLSKRYRIERLIGEGGMGWVYLAADEEVAGETFAVKVLKGSFDARALELMREEVRKTRKLSHPNIVDVHSVNVDGRRLYMLMECLEGKSLRALLNEDFGRGMPFSHAWPVIEDVAAALGHAHDHNVIHADLKPENIFVTTSGRTKLLDFGIARLSRRAQQPAPAGARALTPAYASCQMLQGKDADRRDDVYSFACVIYEMLSGEAPFGELDALEARTADVRMTPLAALSRQQNAALSAALAFDRERRTPSVEGLLAGLRPETPRRALPIGWVAGALLALAAALGLAYLAFLKRGPESSSPVLKAAVNPESRQVTVSPAPAAALFNPPPQSIAVLPFVNLSGDTDQSYFSDGLTEELLNSLTRINELQVAARTSSFSFQGEHPDILTIARKLNVASILEGSVRRSGNTIRVTAQLSDALTGFHLWSQTYDRDVGHVLKLQTEIAQAVTRSLKLTLLGNIAARVELGGTRNPAAFDAYLRGLKFSNTVRDAKDDEAAIAAYRDAIRLDPGYALARAAHSLALTDYADNFATGPAIHASYESAQLDARRAIEGAPALADGYLALGLVLQSEVLDFARAAAEYRHALSLAPGSAQVARRYGHFAILMGDVDASLATTRHAMQLDPLNPAVHRLLSFVLRMARRNQEAVDAAQGALELDRYDPAALTTRGLAYYALGDYQSARSTCEGGRPRANPAGGYFGIEVCLAITYGKLGRQADAQEILTKLRTWYGDRGAYQYAQIYSQWGSSTQALAWLDKALRLRDSGLAELKVDPLLDPLRGEPRFQAIQRALRFP